MSYHVAIVRTKTGKVAPISKLELEDAIASMNGRLALNVNERSEIQIYQPSDGPSSEVMFLDDGEVWAKNPSDSFLLVMIELAGKLEARVRGDELETYRTPEDTYHHPDDFDLIKSVTVESKRLVQMRRRRDWKARALLFGMALLIGLVFIYFKK